MPCTLTGWHWLMRIPGCWKCLIGPFGPRCCALCSRPAAKACVWKPNTYPSTPPNVEVRLIAPHTLVYTGMRWHVRAYCEKNGQYCDFVLSRLRGQPDLLDASPNTREQDEDWNVEVPIIFEPDWRLNAAQKAIIETDFGMTQGQLVVSSRRALVKYVLQRYQIDHRNIAILPEAQQLVVSNLQELQPWLMKY